MGGIHRYDGSPAGLLTLLASTVPRGIVPDEVCVALPPQQSLFEPVTVIDSDPELAESFRQELVRRLTPASLGQLRLAWQGDHPGREMLICRYLCHVWHEGAQAGAMLSHPHVAPFRQLAHRVGREAHRYLGFVRFRETSAGFFYALLSPDHRVLPLIAPHFAERFRDQHWILHDLRHGEGVIHDRTRREWLLLPMEAGDDPELTAGEERMQALWRKYFTALGIDERRNLTLQQGKVPLKVRPWLVEFD